MNKEINRSAELIDAEMYGIIPSELRGEIEKFAKRISDALDFQYLDEAVFLLIEELSKLVDANKLHIPASTFLYAEIKRKLLNKERGQLYKVKVQDEAATII